MFDKLKKMFQSNQSLSTEEKYSEIIEEMESVASLQKRYFDGIEKAFDCMEDGELKDRCISHINIYKKYVEDTMDLSKRFHRNTLILKQIKPGDNNEESKILVSELFHLSSIYACDLIDNTIQPLTNVLSRASKEIVKMVKQ